MSESFEMNISTKPNGQPKNKDAVTRIWGNDPWLRYDLWAGRAWESAERAIAIASDGPISNDESLMSQKTMALFHAAEVARQFAEMVNPAIIFGANDYDDDPSGFDGPEILIHTITEDED